MELYLIRHAQSTNNALPDQTLRVEDPRLTDVGWQQTRRLADYLAAQRLPATEAAHLATNGSNEFNQFNQQGYSFTRLLVSPMTRTLQTAQVLADALGLIPEVWADIFEVGGIYLDYGGPIGEVGLPGRTRTDLQAEFPQAILPDTIGEDGWWWGGRETRPESLLRAGRVMERLAAWAGTDERICMMTHGAFSDRLLKVYGQQALDGVAYFLVNTAISRLDVPAAGRISIRYLNRCAHLTADLLT
ncbi:MAG: histidine phosphatase family protein [Anaerolineae bacterium]|uniref:histidine phosphatase family protein n=1 Tax=Candidatus Amarolinea dominans TaxID=3140696 RepID=UPI00313506EE|nr:histidine phosphatase family protein [Anaerolineae bacterium]